MQPKGPGFWKFNNNLLEDCEYVDKLRVQNGTSLKWKFVVLQSNSQKLKPNDEEMKKHILQNKAVINY